MRKEIDQDEEGRKSIRGLERKMGEEEEYERRGEE
jgi:hypothetical protein